MPFLVVREPFVGMGEMDEHEGIRAVVMALVVSLNLELDPVDRTVAGTERPLVMLASD